MTAARTERHETAVVRRLVDEVMNGRRLGVLDELCTPSMARKWRRWAAPFQASFPDMRMEIVQLVAEGDTVVGRFTCSATHTGEWRGHAATGRRFENVNEVYSSTSKTGGSRRRGGSKTRSIACDSSASRLDRGTCGAYPYGREVLLQPSRM
jgi:predicted ester cyclase